MLNYVLLGFVGAVVALAVYVRVAPTEVAFWHNPRLPVMGPGQYPAPHGFIHQQPQPGAGQAELARLDEIIRATPRTRRLAGSLEEGKITYITRSAIWGFPDYTTVTLTQIPVTGMSTLQVFGRLRFGKSDLGVNRARIEGWLAQLDPTRGTDRPTP